MLTRLEVHGFKNLLGMSVEFGAFTCIAGENGTGKSNVFDAIQFLSLLASTSMMEAAQEVRGVHGERVGDPRDLFWNGYQSGERRISFAAEMIVPEEVEDDFGRPTQPTISFLRYELEIGYQPPHGPEKIGRLRLLTERLEHINQGDAANHLRFPHSAKDFRHQVVFGRRSGRAFISTSWEGGEPIISIHQDGGSRGQPRPAAASRAPATVVSTVTRSDDPTILAARREMQSWRRLALEPSALRASDRYVDPRTMDSDGRHLPGTLYRIATSDESQRDPDRVYAQITGRLADLVGVDVRGVRIEADDVRELLTVYLSEATGLQLAARSLSEGTLRFLALCVLLEDPSVQGLLCMEEPENGLHPANLEAMVRLVRDLAVDPSLPPGPDNPFRQVIINTHSPAIGPAGRACRSSVRFDRTPTGPRRDGNSGTPVTPSRWYMASSCFRRGASHTCGYPAVSHRASKRPTASRVRMTVRVLFLGEGSSDNGLTTHIEHIASSIGVDTVITAPDLARLPSPPGHSVAAKLEAVINMGGVYELVVIHRDADNVEPERRREEIAQAVTSCLPSLTHVPVVPVRMTEAWLLLDEPLLRTVAGNPNGRIPLNLPTIREVEDLPDPKDRLIQTLIEASELRGRRLKTFRQRFPQYRRQMLERLDPGGPVSDVPSWVRFPNDATTALQSLLGPR